MTDDSPPLALHDVLAPLLTAVSLWMNIHTFIHVTDNTTLALLAGR